MASTALDLLLLTVLYVIPSMVSEPASATGRKLRGPQGSIGDVNPPMAKLSSSGSIQSGERGADTVASEASKARFLSQASAQARCEDGSGDRRVGECAEELCHKCLGPGAELVFDPDQGPNGYTTCVYHPPPPDAPNTFCGESFGDGRNVAGALSKCECCYGTGAWLQYVQYAADGLGYTYCHRG